MTPWMIISKRNLPHGFTRLNWSGITYRSFLFDAIELCELCPKVSVRSYTARKAIEPRCTLGGLDPFESDDTAWGASIRCWFATGVFNAVLRYVLVLQRQRVGLFRISLNPLTIYDDKGHRPPLRHGLHSACGLRIFFDIINGKFDSP